MNEDNFYSIDRLVQFGMGIAVSQQMVKTMNETINTMYIPRAMNTMHPPSSEFYYVIIGSNQTGPFSEQELSRLISDGKITKETYAWKPGMLNWEVIEKVPEILRIVALTPPPFTQNI